MAYALAYVLALALFAAIDITWLMSMGSKLYRQTLGDILLTDLRMAPAAVFYLMYPAGLVIFAIAPGLKAASPATALVLGALLGLVAYGTYELTNFATIRNWTLQITVIDIAYGMVASALVAAGVTMIVSYFVGANR
jgi:uncharacterized membrane protein